MGKEYSVQLRRTYPPRPAPVPSPVDETAKMYTWLLGVQREQAAAVAAAAAAGRRAVAAPAWPTLFMQQVATSVQDALVLAKHAMWTNTPRIDAFNARLRGVWKDYASRAVAEGIAPARLLDAHRLSWVLLQRGVTTTHDGVHYSPEFQRTQARVIVNALLAGLALQRQEAAGACGGSAWAWAVGAVAQPAEAAVPVTAEAPAHINGTATAAPADDRLNATVGILHPQHPQHTVAAIADV